MLYSTLAYGWYVLQNFQQVGFASAVLHGY